jgi:Flp pilus assembly protein TadG
MRLSWRRRLSSNERGQALAEFALVLPLVLLFIAGVVEMGRAWNIKQVVTDAAREGARWTVVQDQDLPDLAAVEDKIEERLALGGVTGATIQFSSADPACAVVADCYHDDTGFGKEMTVAVSAPFQMNLIGVLLKWAGGPTTVDITTYATMRNEGGTLPGAAPPAP